MIMEEVRDPAIVVDGSLPEGTTVPVDAIVPFYVTYRDPVSGEWDDRLQTELSVGEFFDLQEKVKQPPGTSQPSPRDFFVTYLRLARAGYKQILVLVVPRSKSRTYASAIDGIDLLHDVEEYKGVEVH